MSALLDDINPKADRPAWLIRQERRLAAINRRYVAKIMKRIGRMKDAV